MSYTTRTSCRVCGNESLIDLFSLGEQYVSGFTYFPYDKPEEKVPIDLELCQECGLVQMKHTAPQEILYRRFYWYRSGVTRTMRDALRDITAKVESTVDLNPDDIVLDIGSNDGTLLRFYQVPCVKVGVEPARNLQKQAHLGTDYLLPDFWDANKYFNMVGRWRRAKVITAIGMFYDLEDPNRFIQDVAEVLDKDGVFIAQLMCLKNMLALGDVGNLAHEHLEFYSLKSLDYLLGKHGLEIFDLETNDVNGESYRLYIRHKSADVGVPCGEQLLNATDNEYAWRLEDPRTYYNFYNRIKENCDKVTEFVRNAVKGGKTVWVYGASTKGNVFLQWAGLDSTLISGAAERSPEKWGKYTIGTNIPIVSEEEARRANPDYFLVLPYAFIDEFVEREKDWLERGGQFIVPLPEFKLIGANHVKT